MRKQGWSATATAEMVCVTTETVGQWVKRVVAEGLDALAIRKVGSGARPKLTATQQEQVLAWGDTTPHLTLRVARWLVPRKHHSQADPAALAAAQKTSLLAAYVAQQPAMHLLFTDVGADDGGGQGRAVVDAGDGGCSACLPGASTPPGSATSSARSRRPTLLSARSPACCWT